MIRSFNQMRNATLISAYFVTLEPVIRFRRIPIVVIVVYELLILFILTRQYIRGEFLAQLLLPSVLAASGLRAERDGQPARGKQSQSNQHHR